MHRGNCPTVPSNPNKANKALFTRLNQRLQRTIVGHRCIPFIRMVQGVHLNQVYLIYPQPLKGAM